MELDIIHWLQSYHNQTLDQFFIFMTMMGEEYFYIFVLSIFYWCINKETARHIVLILMLSSIINGALKETIGALRPFQVESVRTLRIETAAGAAFPSGHTQTATAFFGSIAMIVKKAWVWVACVVIILLVGTSRIYLGLHWPRDVIGGILIGFLVVYLVNKLYVLNLKRDVTWSYFLITLIALISLFWFKSETFIKTTSALIGFMVGYFVEDNFINFDVRASFLIQILKFVIGISTTLLVFEGLKLLLPASVVFISIRYFITVFYVVAGVPQIFVWLKFSRYRIF